MQDPTISNLIDCLGGPAAVARLLTTATKDRITSQAVTNWKRLGIPRGRVADLALARGRVIRSLTDLDPENWPRLFPEIAISLTERKSD
jgi:hypothetical protein